MWIYLIWKDDDNVCCPAPELVDVVSSLDEANSRISNAKETMWMEKWLVETN